MKGKAIRPVEREFYNDALVNKEVIVYLRGGHTFTGVCLGFDSVVETENMFLELVSGYRAKIRLDAIDAMRLQVEGAR